MLKSLFTTLLPFGNSRDNLTLKQYVYAIYDIQLLYVVHLFSSPLSLFLFVLKLEFVKYSKDILNSFYLHKSYTMTITLNFILLIFLKL